MTGSHRALQSRKFFWEFCPVYSLLSDLRVVECASFIAAPSCALHLRQLGAEVIRIDPIGGGPDFNRWPVTAQGKSLYWEGLNKGKKSVAVDLSRPEGRRLAVDLITASGGGSGGSGVFVTNFPKDGFLAHDALAEIRPDLISVRVMGWSNGDSAVDYTINPAIGLPLMTGDDAYGERPVNHVLPAWDLLTGAYAAFATLAAERTRLRTGRGQEVTVPLSDVALAALGNLGQIGEVLTTGDRPRCGNALFGAFGRDFITADRQRIMVVAITRRQWTGLLAALRLKESVGQLESGMQVSFAKDEGMRFMHRDALFPLFEHAIAALNLDQLCTSFDANGVCWSQYRTLRQGLNEDARLSLSSPLFSELTHPSGLQYPAPGAAATFADDEREPGVRAPYLGEHTDEVLSEVLSLSASEIGKLHDAGLVADSAST
jgi:2-methylfumaryl-CoA isomerase